MVFTAMGLKENLPLANIVIASIQSVIGLIREDRRLTIELKNGLQSIKQDLQMIEATIRDNEAAIRENEELLLQELAFDIEDYVDLLRIPGRVEAFVLSAVGMDPRDELLGNITRFKERIKSFSEKIRQQKSYESSQSGAGTPEDSPYYTPEDRLVGISEPKRELLELLTAADGWQPEQLRVISIVGPRGVGKTALARAVHDAEKFSGGGPAVHDGPVVADKFDCVAWVVVSECSNKKDLLEKIKQHVAHDILKDNRYLVFIDDLQPTIFWKDIERQFPRNDKGSRIIVTTSDRSVAKACSSRGDRYVYTMGGLGGDDSEQLFWRNVNGYQTEPAPSPALVDGSKSIFTKCGGLPLALISVADYLGTQRQNPTKALCKHVGEALGDYLSGDEIAFREIKRALVQCYDNLRDCGDKTCLLSLSIFPRGHQINRKSLIRRILAERLIGDVRNCLEKLIEDVRNCLKKLIDRSIIKSVQIQNNCKVVERCQVHSIMLLFTIHKSVSKNFVTLIHRDKPQHNKDVGTVRRLSVQSSTKVGCDKFVNKNGLSAVRSLTIFNSELLDFKECKSLRVLDLEGCKGLEKVIDDICEFLFLKYLSLRGSDVPRIPMTIGKLYNLETLDIRETPVEILPMEVIMLPNLVYLFGEFELPPETKELETFLSKNSKLKTLAGFVINKTQGFENIILHAKDLRKIKVWCEDTATPAPRSTPAPAPAPSKTPAPAPAPAPSNNPLTAIFASSLKKRFIDLESLSIDSSGLSKAFLSSLRAPSVISTIKLRGKLESLPDSTTLRHLKNLTKLHLLSTGLRSEALYVLQSLPCLEYLKVAEDGNEFEDNSEFVVHSGGNAEDGNESGNSSKFVERSGGFPSLQELWFERPRLPRMQIKKGAMTKLTTLQLLCPEFADGFGDTCIVHLESLNKVVLHPSVRNDALEAWKRAANQHKNRPHVKKQPTA